MKHSNTATAATLGCCKREAEIAGSVSRNTKNQTDSSIFTGGAEPEEAQIPTCFFTSWEFPKSEGKNNWVICKKPQAKQWYFIVINPTQVLLAPSWWEGKLFDQILSLVVSPSTSSLHSNPNAKGTSTRTCPTTSIFLDGGTQGWLPGLRQVISISFVPMKVWAAKNRWEHEVGHLMKSLSVSVRLHAGEDTRKDVRGQEHRRQHIRVCDNVCERKKIDMRAVHGVTSFHSMNKHRWVCRRVMNSTRNPSKSKSMEETQDIDESNITVELLRRTEPHVNFSLYCILLFSTKY